MFDAILMAGGKGERLRPLTINTPKPLLKLGDRLIIDYLVDKLKLMNECSSIQVTINYLKERFLQKFAFSHIKCVQESKFLGTLGAVSLCDITSEDTFIANSDIYTNLDIKEMYRYHKFNQADITVLTIPYKVQVPFGVFDKDDNGIIKEKPTYEYWCSGGIYFIKSKILDLLPKDTRCDAPDFINSHYKEFRIIPFKFSGTWLDIGTPQAYEEANKLLTEGLDSRS